MSCSRRGPAPPELEIAPHPAARTPPRCCRAVPSRPSSEAQAGGAHGRHYPPPCPERSLPRPAEGRGRDGKRRFPRKRWRYGAQSRPALTWRGGGVRRARDVRSLRQPGGEKERAGLRQRLLPVTPQQGAPLLDEAGGAGQPMGSCGITATAARDSTGPRMRVWGHGSSCFHFA